MSDLDRETNSIKKTQGGDIVALSLSSVSKYFGNFQALDGISLDIYQGEFVCFLGPSGCGKTTLLRIIAGLEKPSEGKIIQKGEDITFAEPRNRDFGIVFQSYALFPNLKIRDNVGYGLVNRKWTKSQINERVSELLELVGLESETEKYPAQLSGGQQQRVALARALATSPGLLLLDEPLSALDARVRLMLQTELRMLQEKLKVTTIMVTHDQDEAISLADRIFVMNEGQIAQVGTPTDIYNTPGTLFIADFIGKMNVLHGHVAEEGSVLVNGTELLCDTDLLPKDTSISICIRPEDVSLEDDENDSPNIISVKIKTLRFMGSHYRAIVGGVNGSEFNLGISPDSSTIIKDKIKIGSELKINIPPEKIQVFREEDA